MLKSNPKYVASIFISLDPVSRKVPFGCTPTTGLSIRKLYDHGNKIQLFVTAITADGNVNTKFNNIRTVFFFVSPYIKKDKATIGKLPTKRQIVAITN